MSGCNDKIKTRCKKVDANCTYYGTTLPGFSELEDCITIAETTEELYNLVGEIRAEINLTDLEGDCVTNPTTPTVKNVIQMLINKICNQQTEINNQRDLIETIQQQITALQESTCQHCKKAHAHKN